MIKSIHITNFKGFQEFEIAFQRINLLVGGNNSGKTTIFHALQTFFWCLEQTAEASASEVTLKKTQVPEIGAVPYFSTRDLFFNQRQRSGKAPTRINLTLRTDIADPVAFDIYTAFSRNVMIDGHNRKLSRDHFDQIAALKPIFIPGTIGITPKEELYREVAQERLITEGRQNQVLRNLVYRLKSKNEWDDYVAIIRRLFKFEKIDVPFNEKQDEWLTATYAEGESVFDFISAGSGFLQVVNLLSFLFLHTSRVALLDEPDSHMHDDLQKLTFNLLDELSEQRNIQLIIATHSSTLIDAAGLENVLLIDKTASEPIQPKDVDTLVPLLADRGLALPPTKVMNTLKTRKVLFVEGKESDFEDFVLRMGETIDPDFGAKVRGLTVFETGGATKEWAPEAITAFKQLIGVDVMYVYLSDRDFFTDTQVAEREKKIADTGGTMIHLDRRNRESYLLEPRVLARVLKSRWSGKKKNADKDLPTLLTTAGIKDFILTQAQALESETQASLLLFQEQSLRLPHHEKKIATKELLEWFTKEYRDKLAAKEIPWRFLDAKRVLSTLRDKVTKECGLSFSDRDILAAYKKDEISTDVVGVIRATGKMFDVAPAAPKKVAKAS